MSYTSSQMVYKDYRWTAKADRDNPSIIDGKDHTSLNRTEGYEMLHFINSLAKTWNWQSDPVASYQHLEKIIRTEVPREHETYLYIKEWIQKHYPKV